MTSIYSIAKDTDGQWKKKNVVTKVVSGSYPDKQTALVEGRSIAKKGATVVIHATNGSIQQVLGSRDVVKKAPVKRRLTNKSVDLAIARALEQL